MVNIRVQSAQRWVAVAAVLCLVCVPLGGAFVTQAGQRGGRTGFQNTVSASSFSDGGGSSAFISAAGDGTVTGFTSAGSGRLFRDRLRLRNTPVSFEVAGSDFLPIPTFEDIEEEVDERAGLRPAGDWVVVVEGRVPSSVETIWETTKNVGFLFQYAFQDLANSVDPVTEDQQEWRIRLASGERIFLSLLETDHESNFHVINIVSHSDGVFPGFSAEDTRVFFLVLPGDTDGTSIIEFGWEDGASQGPELGIESLFQEMVSNLEDKFGNTCELSRNVRSIEGECNNLGDPKLGAANHPLSRLPKHDPSYIDDFGTPSGADISPRIISNEICAQSPGIDFLQARLEEMDSECFDGEEAGSGWEVCPMISAKHVTLGATKFDMDFKEFISNPDGSVNLLYDDLDGCSLSVKFICGGEEKLVMDDLGGLDVFGDSCEHFGWLYSPNACSKVTGDDDAGNSKIGLTDLFWSFGQFIDHDLDLTPTTQLADDNQPGFNNFGGSDDHLPISVPEEDFFFEGELDFERATVFTGLETSASRRTHLNQHSAYLDLGQVYGVDFLRANTLRDFQGGKLKVAPDGMLPFNKLSGEGALGAKLSNAPSAGDEFMAAGDIRANEQPLLLAYHIFWVREHNLVCDELAELFPDWDDEQLYQTARTIVISEYQSIVYTEWLALLLGEGAIDAGAYSYSASVDPSIQAFFSTAAFRVGHTMVSSNLWRMKKGEQDSPTAVPLRDIFFKPDVVFNGGLDEFIRGGAFHVCKEIDEKVVDELRNFLFAEDGGGGTHDLVSLNIQRGRDMGLPSFNHARDAYSLPSYTDFSEVTDDKFGWKTLQKVYKGSIGSIDAFVGGLIEKKAEGSQLGELFHTAVLDQFVRMRDGDRFFYKGVKWSDEVLESYPRATAIINDEVKMVDIIARTTGCEADEFKDGKVFQV